MAVDKNKVAADATKLIQKGQFDKAIRAYEKILVEDPKDTRVLLKIGELQQKKGDTPGAAATFGRVADAYAEQGFFLKSVAVFKQMLKLVPDDVRVNERLAALYQQLGILSDAMAQLQLVAASAERAGDDGRLQQVLQRMSELEPDNVGAAVKLGELLARREDRVAALLQLRRACEVLRRGNRADEWLKVAERVVFLDPDDLPLTRELANVYLAKGDTKRALAKLQLSLKAEPKDLETLMLLAQAFNELGQTAKTVSVHRELAHLHAERGHAEEALASWRRVIELAPGDEEALAAVGLPSDPPAAAAPVPPQPSSPETLPSPPGPAPSTPPAAAPAPRVLGPEAIAKLLTETDVYVKYGLHEKALEHLRRVFEIDPDHLEAHEKALRLRALRNDPAGAGDEAAQVVRLARERGLEGRAGAALERLRELAPDHPLLSALARPATGTAPAPGEPALDEDQVAEAAARAEQEALATADGDLLVEVEAPDDLLDESEVVEIVDLEPIDDEEEASPGEERAALADAGRGEDAGAPVRPFPLAPPPLPSGPFPLPDEGLFSAPWPEELAPPPPPGVAGERSLEAFQQSEPVLEPVLEPVPAEADARDGLAPEPPSGEAPPSPTPQLTDEAGGEPEEQEDLDEDLAEIAFLSGQDLLDEAGEALANLQRFYPRHPKLLAAAAELAERVRSAAARAEAQPPAEDSSHPSAAAPPDRAPAVPPSAGAGDELLELTQELTQGFTQEHATTGSRSLQEDFGFSAQDVLDQFRRGVAEAVEPEDQETHYDLGIAYKEMGLLDDALRELDLALAGAGRGKEVDCLTMVGLCRREQGDAAGAAEAFQRALRAERLTAEAEQALRYELACAYHAAGDREAALYYYQAVASKDPSYRDARARAAELGGGAGRAPAAARP